MYGITQLLCLNPDDPDSICDGYYDCLNQIDEMYCYGENYNLAEYMTITKCIINASVCFATI